MQRRDREGTSIGRKETHRWKIQRLDTRQRQGEDEELDNEEDDAGEKREMHSSADRSTNRLTNICPLPSETYLFLLRLL